MPISSQSRLISFVLSKAPTKALSQICQKLLCRCNCASRMISFFSLGMNPSHLERRDCFAFADSFLLFAKWSNRSLTDSTVCKIKVAINSHAPALYSVAIIQVNSSSGTKNDKHLRAGVANCARVAFRVDHRLLKSAIFS
ncbi:hypothetical protein QN277_021349 [Acacia crassicarpa]|uniref:Uncharacterized protein n=1 Tax=Acacia crassicarpa TaxID=499986 RepID=A0AAE1JLK7_9FABA|nr:hypothetical protein QN277_021349 [Acacia crassicarpa]